MKTLLFISIGILAIFLLFQGCTSNQYVFDCFSKDNRLMHREVKNHLIHSQMMSPEFDRCETYIYRSEVK